MTRRAAWLLFWLAPFVAEILPGVNPPALLVRQPWALVGLVSLYGSAALLARDLTRRWRGGAATLLLLGAAHGAVEEGLMVNSFFDPHWLRLPALQGYGRWTGVNGVWALHLLVYHTVFSIAVPVVLVELAFPAVRARPWLGPRGFMAVAGLWALRVGLGARFDTPYRLSPAQTAGTVALAAALVAAAYALARGARTGRARRAPSRRGLRPATVALVSGAATVAFFGVSWGLPLAGVSAGLVLALLLALVAAAAYAGARARDRAWDDRHTLALVAGPLGFFILLAPLQEWRPDPTTLKQGMTLTAAVTAAAVGFLARRVTARVRDARPARGTISSTTPHAEERP